ncbi:MULTISPECIES: tail fiber domain-containing protein [Heyndrickxia]|uniref:tail fiber domain-containing protein n=1 Tax=Heyndrickxia TaxID=2837504 RepID=UPI0011588769|nr:tail fiber domain-containing protein [Heyndrickxia sporothermodurans]
MWLDTSDPNQYVLRTFNANQNQWVTMKGDKGDKGDKGETGPAGKDGIAYMGTTAPNNPATNSTWFQTDSTGKVIAIKKWTGSAWTTSKMDADTLSVGELSALSADLGKVTAGNITGVTMNLAGGKFVVDSDGNVTVKGKIDGSTITGSSFTTTDNSTSGQIKIEGSNFISTKYGTSGNEYVKITNGTLEIRTLSAFANSYQTVKINGNTGINITTDVNTDASMRFDVYETLSSRTDTKFGIKATSNLASDIITLYLESDDNVIVNASNIELNGLIKFGSAFRYSNGFIEAPSGSVSIAQNTITADTFFFGKYGVLKYDAGSLYAPSGSTKIQENTITANTYNFGNNILKYESGSLTAPAGSLSISQNTVKANTITQLSNAEYKKNIDVWNYNATEMILSTPIRQFQYKNELDEEFPHVGIIVQEAPVWAIELGGDGADLGAMVSMSWKSLQELHERIEMLEQKLGGAA